MAEILTFPGTDQELDLDRLTRDELLNALLAVRDEIDMLDLQEPEDMASEEYEIWGEKHEDLEDLADELQEKLDDLEAE